MRRFAAAAVLLFLFSGSASAARAAETPVPPREITVSGEAEVKVVPDQVILSLAVETNDKDLNLAKQQNDERVKKVLEIATQQFKIEKKHVQTDQISIEPRYDTSGRSSTFTGYWVRKSIVICVKDMTRFEDLLTAVIKAGTNFVPGVEFQSTQLRKHRDLARSMAVKAAKEKAVAMAGDLGQKVGRPLSISETSPGYYGFSRSAYSNAQQNASAGGGGGGEVEDTSGETFAPGEISVRANVTVRFELE